MAEKEKQGQSGHALSAGTAGTLSVEDQAYRNKLRRLALTYTNVIKKYLQNIGKVHQNCEKDNKNIAFCKNMLQMFTKPHKRYPMEAILKCEKVLKMTFGPEKAATSIPDARLQNKAATSTYEARLQQKASTSLLDARLQQIIASSIHDARLQHKAATSTHEARLQQKAASSSTREARLQQKAASSSTHDARLQNKAATSTHEARLQNKAASSSTHEARLQQKVSTSSLQETLEQLKAISTPVARLQQKSASSTSDARLQRKAATSTPDARLSQKEASSTSDARLQQKTTSSTHDVRLQQKAATSKHEARLQKMVATCNPDANLKQRAVNPSLDRRLQQKTVTSSAEERLQQKTVTSSAKERLQQKTVTSAANGSSVTLSYNERIQKIIKSSFDARFQQRSRLQEISNSSTPDSRLQQRSTTSTPDSRLQQRSNSSIPDSRLQQRSNTSAHGSRLQQRSSSSTPDSRLQQRSTSSTPDSRLQQRSNSSIPDFRLQQRSTSSTPDSRLQQRSNSSTLDSRLQQMSNSSIPDSRLQQRLISSIPDSRLQQRSISSIPDFRLQQKSNTSTPEFRLEKKINTSTSDSRLQQRSKPSTSDSRLQQRSKPSTSDSSTLQERSQPSTSDSSTLQQRSTTSTPDSSTLQQRSTTSIPDSSTLQQRSNSSTLESRLQQKVDTFKLKGRLQQKRKNSNCDDWSQQMSAASVTRLEGPPQKKPRLVEEAKTSTLQSGQKLKPYQKQDMSNSGSRPDPQTYSHTHPAQVSGHNSGAFCTFVNKIKERYKNDRSKLVLALSKLKESFPVFSQKQGPEDSHCSKTASAQLTGVSNQPLSPKHCIHSPGISCAVPPVPVSSTKASCSSSNKPAVSREHTQKIVNDRQNVNNRQHSLYLRQKRAHDVSSSNCTSDDSNTPPPKKQVKTTDSAFSNPGQHIQKDEQSSNRRSSLQNDPGKAAVLHSTSVEKSSTVQCRKMETNKAKTNTCPAQTVQVKSNNGIADSNKAPTIEVNSGSAKTQINRMKSDTRQSQNKAPTIQVTSRAAAHANAPTFQVKSATGTTGCAEASTIQMKSNTSTGTHTKVGVNQVKSCISLSQNKAPTIQMSSGSDAHAKAAVNQMKSGTSVPAEAAKSYSKENPALCGVAISLRGSCRSVVPSLVIQSRKTGEATQCRYIPMQATLSISSATDKTISGKSREKSTMDTPKVVETNTSHGCDGCNENHDRTPIRIDETKADECRVPTKTPAVSSPSRPSNDQPQTAIHTTHSTSCAISSNSVSSSATSAASSDSVSNSGTSEDKREDGDTECIYCFENPVNTVIYTCGHMCLCFECAGKVKDKKKECPICRTVIIDIIKIYKA